MPFQSRNSRTLVSKSNKSSKYNSYADSKKTDRNTEESPRFRKYRAAGSSSTAPSGDNPIRPRSERFAKNDGFRAASKDSFRRSRRGPRKEANISAVPHPEGSERLQKLIAQAGSGSRRDAEAWIEAGEVTINGKTAALGDRAIWGKDAIKVRGKLLHSKEAIATYIAYKPRACLCQLEPDPEGRPTLGDVFALPKERVYLLDRLEFLDEGLVILTNDGDLKERTRLSKSILKVFHLKTADRVPADRLAKIAQGGFVDGLRISPVHAHIVREFQRNALVEIAFIGSTQFDIREYCMRRGVLIEKVTRLTYGPFGIDQFAPGTLKRITAPERQLLLENPELVLEAYESKALEIDERVRQAALDMARHPAQTEVHDHRSDGAKGRFTAKNDFDFSRITPAQPAAREKREQDRPRFSRSEEARPRFHNRREDDRPSFHRGGGPRPKASRPR